MMIKIWKNFCEILIKDMIKYIFNYLMSIFSFLKVFFDEINFFMIMGIEMGVMRYVSEELEEFLFF